MLFLCTDGLSGTVSGDEMLQIYREYSFDQFTSKLIERANSAGGKDNITVVAVQA